MKVVVLTITLVLTVTISTSVAQLYIKITEVSPWNDIMEEGISLYHSRNFNEAKKSFEKAEAYLSDETKLSGRQKNLKLAETVMWQGMAYNKSFSMLIISENSFERAATICRQNNMVDSELYADILHEWGNIYLEEKQMHKKADSLFTKALSIKDKKLGKNNLSYATTLMAAGRLRYLQGRFKDSEKFLTEANDFFKINGQKVQFAESLIYLGSLYKAIGSYSKTEEYFQQAVQVTHNSLQVMSEDNSNFIQTKFLYLEASRLLASFYLFLENYPAAEKFITPAFEMLKTDKSKIWSKAKESVSKIYDFSTYDFGMQTGSGRWEEDYLVALFRSKGNAPQWGLEGYFYRALYSCAKIYDTNHPNYVEILYQFGNALQEQNFLFQADSILRQAATIGIDSAGKKHPLYALTNLALTKIFEKGNSFYDEDRLLSESSNTLNEKITIFLYAKALGYRGDYYKALQNYGASEKSYLKAKELIPESHIYSLPYVQALNSLAALYLETNDSTKAKIAIDESIRIANKIFKKIPKPVEYAKAYANQFFYDQSQGKLNIGALINAENGERGDLVRAIYEYSTSHFPDFLPEEQFDKIRKEIATRASSKHPDYLLASTYLARIKVVKGKQDEAKQLFLELDQVYQDEISTSFPYLTEKGKELFYGKYQNFTREFKAYLIERISKDKDNASILINHQIATKGFLFQNSEGIRDRIVKGSDEVKKLYQKLLRQKDLLLKVNQMPSTYKKEKNIDELQLEDEISIVEKTLFERLSIKPSSGSMGVSWTAIRSALKPEEMAVELVRCEIHLKKRDYTDLIFMKKSFTADEWKSIEKNHGIPAKTVIKYAALLVKSSTTDYPEVVILENGDDLEKRFLAYYRNKLKMGDSDSSSYDQFWKPIAEKAKGAKKIYLSADGVYNQINVSSLYNQETSRFVFDEAEIHLLSNLKDLLTGSASKIVPKGAALFGFPNYNNAEPSAPDTMRLLSFTTLVGKINIRNDTTLRFFSTENIAELPGTKDEINSIQKLFQGKNIKVTKFLYNQASEVQIKRLASPAVLHISTHGFFLKNVPTPSDTEVAFAGFTSQKIQENPLLRSGLLLAGAKNGLVNNKSAIPHGEDGILFAHEILSLDLQHTDLVVLSACETGLGVNMNGEGVYGLQRAFQIAGAKYVLMSLWSVDDIATRDLMISFYQNWLIGKTINESLRNAQIGLRKKYPNPFYWAAFVLVGQ